MNSKRARKRLDSSLLYSIACRKLDMLNASINWMDFKRQPANRLEVLKGSFKGKYSIRINDQYPVVFTWDIRGPEQVEIIDDH
ncbi:type II toxin-antitoxin system RelE/ParE family toxin [Neochlamydia sp. EPS4]|uniref:type II toxin-antitoxin system RelE/ParE family toxin n=1 Tax=Neochlamydia sp. EPS4 TaxID=1478175 RepID=UPI0005D0F882|nr:type II toxin-antitoxin system RelE/ParE family toxin [Neochlamydia sp. EPS4]